MMGRSATDPALSSQIPTFAGLIFKVYDNAGASREYSTRDFNLVPLNPLHVNAFEEKYETMDFPSYHGTPEKAPLGKRVFQNSTGSWDFYYVADGVPHSSWDDYGRHAMDDVREKAPYNTFIPQNTFVLFSRSGTKLPPFGGSLRTDVRTGLLDKVYRGLFYK